MIPILIGAFLFWAGYEIFSDAAKDYKSKLIKKALLAPFQGMQGETATEVAYMPPGQFEKEQQEKKLMQRVEAVSKSNNPQAIVRLAIKLQRKYPTTADVLFGKAVKIEQQLERHKKIAIPSPIAGVSNYKWGLYTRRMTKMVKPSPSRIGIFGMSMPRLKDLGIITKIEGNTVEWNEKTNPEDFEENKALQYACFARSSKDHAKKIKDAGMLKTEISGEPATLSGLMAAAHLAGWPGFQNWVKSDRDKEKFPATTEAYQKFNGMF